MTNDMIPWALVAISVAVVAWAYCEWHFYKANHKRWYAEYVERHRGDKS